MSLDDKLLFLDAMEDARPLRHATDVHWHPTRNQRTPQHIDTLQFDNFLTTGFPNIVPLNQSLEFRRKRLQHGVLDELRSDKHPQQANLNLLHRPVEGCRKMVFSFIQQTLADGLRSVLIIHDKGRGDKLRASAVHSYMTHWLTEFDGVQTYCTALPRHGGSGACYVALHKTAQAEQENWGRHVKHGRWSRDASAAYATGTQLHPSFFARYKASSARLDSSSVLSFLS